MYQREETIDHLEKQVSLIPIHFLVTCSLDSVFMSKTS